MHRSHDAPKVDARSPHQRIQDIAELETEIERLRQQNCQLRAALKEPQMQLEATDSQTTSNTGKIYRILCCDGGGMKGLFMAVLLKRLQQLVPHFLEGTDLFAGTSAGSLLAALLASGEDPENAIEMWKEKSWRFFEKKRGPSLRSQIEYYTGTNIFAAKYESTNFSVPLSETVLHGKTFGELPKKLLILAVEVADAAAPPSSLMQPARSSSMSRLYSIGARHLGSQYDGVWRPKVFHNLGDKPQETFVTDAVVASSAVPTLFPVHQGCADGLLAANNPAMFALVSAQQHQVKIEDVRLLSLGTGMHRESLRSNLGGNMAGLSQWATDIIAIMTEMNTQCPSLYCSGILGDHYCRLNPEVDKYMDPLDASEKTIQTIFDLANEVDLTPTAKWLREQWMENSAVAI